MNKIWDFLLLSGRCRRVSTCILLALPFVGFSFWGCQQQELKTEPNPEQLQEPAQQQNSPITKYQYTQLHLGVQVRIVLFAEKEADAIAATTLAFAKIATLEDIFSNYRQDSELSRLSKAPTYEPSLVSDELFTVIDFAQSLSQETDGAFDITLGPYIALWKEARENNRLPDMVKLESATAKVGWQLLKVNEEKKSITLNQKSMALDLGGIAKGYILDKALEILSSNGIQSALIEAGGDIVVSGPPPEKTGWEIDIPGAKPESKIASKAKNLTHAAISTSGDTEQFVDIDGVRYSHVIDPSTGMGSTRRLMVTVIAPTGMVSDSYATALGVMKGTEQAGFLRKHPDILAYIRQIE